MSKSHVSIRAATASDCALLLTLIKELAEYERLSHKVSATPESLEKWLMSPHAIAKAVLAEIDGQAVGYAVFFPYFSTFRGGPGMYLEDIYVRPAVRGRGVGEAMLRHVARAAADLDCDRLEWVVLDWNKPAIDFYERLGATADAKEWITYSLYGDKLIALACPPR